MIHFSEQITIVNEYEIWLENRPDIHDGPLAFIMFLREKNVIDEFKIHEYVKEVKNGKKA